MFKIIFRVFAVILVGVVFGIIGLIVGALIGGNYAQQFVFNGVRGYEATGQLGLTIATLIGLISGWRFLFKRKSISSSK
jgi:predicted MFS family arabinose efflux permease